MAELVIAAVGYAASGAVGGGLTGAIVGAVVTTALTAAFTPTQKSYGPRLGDLTVTGSTYGAPVPWVAGTPRISGQVIWASDKREIATTTEQGKGGGSEYTSYPSEVDLLILLSENSVPGLGRVWKTGDLIYNVTASADAATLAASLSTTAWERITYYDGNASQLPDPDYEAAVGTANAVAYRGRSSVFIKSLQLDSGGNLPNLTFEQSESVPETTLGAEVSLGTGTSSVVVAFNSAKIAVIYIGASGYLNKALIAVSGDALSVDSNVLQDSVSSSVHDVCKLTSGHALLSYSNGSTHYCAGIGYVGTTLVFGTPQNVSGAGSGTTVSELESNKVLVLYNDGSNLYARVLTISVVSITNVGAAYMGPACQNAPPAAVALSATAGVAVYHEPSTWDVYCVGMTITGDVVSFGTPALVSDVAAAAGGLSISKIDAGSALCTYTALNSGAVLQNESAVVAPAGAGTPVVLKTGVLPGTNVAVTPGGQAVYMYRNTAEEAVAKQLSAGGAGLGSEIEVSAYQYSTGDLYPVDTGKAAASYARSGGIYARIVQMS